MVESKYHEMEPSQAKRPRINEMEDPNDSCWSNETVSFDMSQSDIEDQTDDPQVDKIPNNSGQKSS